MPQEVGEKYVQFACQLEIRIVKMWRIFFGRPKNRQTNQTKTSDVEMEVEIAHDSDHSHIQDGQIHTIQIEKVTKRAVLFHLASTKNNNREDISHRAENEEANWHRGPNIVESYLISVFELGAGCWDLWRSFCGPSNRLVRRSIGARYLRQLNVVVDE